MTSLTELPVEVVNLMFEYMDLVEICSCRLVSKWFNETVKSFRVFELNFYDKDWFRRSRWYGDDKPMLPLNSLSVSKVPFLSSPSVDLRFLKRLSFKNIKESDKFRLELLNSFQWLEHLELWFEEPNWWQGDRVKRLKLDQLVLLFLSFKFQIFIEFDAPKLGELALSYLPGENERVDVHQLMEGIHFVHPKTVWRLDLFGELNRTGYLLSSSSFQDFEGVEHFQCNLTPGSSYQMEAILTKFSRLKVLEVWLNEGAKVFDGDFEILNQIMQQKEVLKPSLRVYFCDVELASERPAESYAFGRESKLASLVHNYSSLVYSHSVFRVDYDELLRLTNGQYQTFKLFNTTTRVIVNEFISHPERFLNFLLSCPNLGSLILINSSLDTEFYRRLPTYTSLHELNITVDQDLRLDFKFLLKIKNLIHFITNQNLDLDLDVVRVIAQQLKFVSYFEFAIKKQHFEILKIDDQFHLNRVNSYGEKIEHCLSVSKLEDLVEYFENSSI